MPDLISDGGSMTIGRRTASWAYGSFEVTLPEGDQQAEDDGRLADGYIYRPDDREHGRFDLTFVRADVRIDMNSNRSDLETTLDQASRRTAGNAFYTRELTGPSLGHKRPGVDYDRGDIVDVMVWGQIMALPVTDIRAISTPETPIGWAVRVGGQALADPEALRKRTNELEAQIAAEKRQRLSQHEKQQSMNIQAAQDTAAAAQAAANANAEALALREAMDEERLAEDQARWLESQAATTSLVEALGLVSRTYFGHSRTSRNLASEPYWRHSSSGDAVTFTAKGTWRGHVTWISQIGQAVEVLESSIPTASGGRSITTPGRALLIFQVQPGQVLSTSEEAPSRTVTKSTWPTVGSWTVPAGTVRAAVKLTARFLSLEILNTVGLRVRRGSTDLGVRHYGPRLVGLLGGGATVTLTVPMKNVTPGQLLELQVSASGTKTMSWARWEIIYETES